MNRMITWMPSFQQNCIACLLCTGLCTGVSIGLWLPVWRRGIYIKEGERILSGGEGGF